MSTTRITKSKVDGLIAPASGQSFLRDSELKGFGVRITAGGTRSFVLEKRIDGRLRRFTLAKYPELTVEQARKEAQAQLGKIATGGNPIAEKKARQAPKLTLSQAFIDFKLARRALSPKTIALYQYAHDSCLTDWRTRPLVDITKDQIIRKHAELAVRGDYVANFAMRFLSSIYSFAIGHYENAAGNPVIVRNPVDAIRRNHGWFTETRRQRYVAPAQMPAWDRAVGVLRQDKNPHTARVADYLRVLLFTGLRMREGMRIKVGDVDLAGRMLTVHKTKNGKPLVLPLPAYLIGVLKPHVENREPDAYLFPGANGEKSISPPHRYCKAIATASGVSFSPHDLRRTFITTAERLEISMIAIKRLVNHSGSDVTAGYVVMDIERLRAPMERIASALLAQMASDDQPRVVELDDRRRASA